MSVGITHIVAALVKAGATPEMILAAVAADAEHTAACYAEEERRVAVLNEARRAASREKKRAQRLTKSLNVPRTNGDRAGQSGTDGDTVSPKNPPLEITPLKITPSDNSVEAREGAPESGCRLEFTYEFWPAYPHQVGMRRALQAFIAARQRASLKTIMAGVARYRSSKPPDRQWLNPASFLEEDRFHDKPASPPPSDRGNRPKSPHDAIREAFIREAEKELGQGGDGPGSDGRDDDHRAGPDGSGGQHLDLGTDAFRRAG